MDSSGNAWVSDANTNTVTKVSSSGTIVGGYTSGGLNLPHTVSIDGAGNVWVANLGTSVSSVTELSSTGAPLSGTNGYQYYAANGLGQIAIDGSGDVWLPGVGYLVEYIGLATPVVTPLATGVATSSLGRGHEPNLKGTSFRRALRACKLTGL
jgi:streptogramin lyase